MIDGTTTDLDQQDLLAPLRAAWSGFTDAEGAIASYQWRIETADGTLVEDWTDVGLATSAANATAPRIAGQRYRSLVRAADAAGNWSPSASSNGVWMLGSQPAPWALQIERHGITWQLAAPRPFGTFANGDPWVLGPIDIIAIAPGCTDYGGRTVHGSMVDPAPDGIQGYDSDLYANFADGRYDASRNRGLGVDADHPLHLDGDHSLISVESRVTPDADPSLSQLRRAAVLTVLAATPAADAFRPPYAGTEKAVRFTERDLHWARLLRLRRPIDAPDPAAIAARFEHVWLDHCPGWLSRYLHPVENMHDYSRDFTADIGSAALLLQLDLPRADQRDLLVRLVQLGIDNWANVQGGCAWPGTGGQCSGRKFPILFAGAMLADAAMLAVGTSYATHDFGPGDPRNTTTFGEDSQTFFVRETAPGTWNWGFGAYRASDDGLPEWGFAHVPSPMDDAAAWSADPYRICCTANAWVGEALAIRMMGLTDAWGHPAFFAYLDRYLGREPLGSWTRSWEPWHQRMWDRWRRSY